jgi:hypothetical protein
MSSESQALYRILAAYLVGLSTGIMVALLVLSR